HRHPRARRARAPGLARGPLLCGGKVSRALLRRLRRRGARRSGFFAGRRRRRLPRRGERRARAQPQARRRPREWRARRRARKRSPRSRGRARRSRRRAGGGLVRTVIAVALDLLREAQSRRWFLVLAIAITILLVVFGLALRMDVVDGALAATRL